MVFDHDILLLIVAHFAQPLPKGGSIGCRGIGGPTVDKCDYGWHRLLRSHRKRPSSCRAANKRDELPPPHSITSSARSNNASGIFSPSALAVVRLMTRLNLVGCSTGMSPGFVPRRILSTSSAARRN